MFLYQKIPGCTRDRCKVWGLNRSLVSFFHFADFCQYLTKKSFFLQTKNWTGTCVQTNMSCQHVAPCKASSTHLQNYKLAFTRRQLENMSSPHKSTPWTGRSCWSPPSEPCVLRPCASPAGRGGRTFDRTLGSCKWSLVAMPTPPPLLCCWSWWSLWWWWSWWWGTWAGEGRQHGLYKNEKVWCLRSKESLKVRKPLSTNN